MTLARLLNKRRIAILGYGMEGQSSVRFLLKHGVAKESIVIHDGNSECLVPTGIDSVLGEAYMDGLDMYDAIIKTPGISPYHEKIAPVRDKLISNSLLFLQQYKGNVIAVTGTKGKSTTCTLLEQALVTAGKKVLLLGNIGKPCLDALEELQQMNYDFVVFEMSSFMIESLHDVTLYACLITNIYAAHMDWHHGLENYHNDKIRLARFCDRVLVYHETRQGFQQFFDDVDADVTTFGDGGMYYEVDKQFFCGEELLGGIDSMQLLGRHNRTNACAVLAFTHGALELSLDDVRQGIQAVTPLPHRLNMLGEFAGRLFIDDAIATTPASTLQALNTMQEENWSIGCLFLGGLDHGFDFTRLVEKIIQLDIKNIVCFPDSGFAIKKMLDARNHHYHAFVTISMKDAVAHAYKVAPEGTVVLLSCAGPSMSVRKSYKEKGTLFHHYAQELGKK